MSLSTLKIEYCPKCGWLLRATWLAQELLTTFSEERLGVLLRPAEEAGHFSVTLDDEVLWNRKHEGRFPEPKEIKLIVRDRIAPSKSLGHSERKN